MKRVCPEVSMSLLDRGEGSGSVEVSGGGKKKKKSYASTHPLLLAQPHLHDFEISFCFLKTGNFLVKASRKAEVSFSLHLGKGKPLFPFK